MKTLKRLVITVSVLAIGGYSAFWYYQAGHMQNLLQDEINQLNGSGYGFTVQYDKIAKSGYPWDVQIELLNPKIKTTKDEIGEKKESLEVDVDGKIVSLFSVIGQRKGVALKGNTYLYLPETDMMPASKLLVKGEMAGKVDRINPSDVKVDFSQLSFFDVSEGQEEPKINVDYASFHFVHKESLPASQHIHCNIDVEGLDTSHLLFGNKQTWNAISRLDQIFRTKLGKINFSSDLKVQIPTKEEIKKIVASPVALIADKLPTITIDLNDCSLSDKYHTIEGTVHFALQEEKDVSIKTAVDVKTKMSDEYYTLLGESIDQLEKEIEALSSEQQKEQIDYLQTIKENIYLFKKCSIDGIAIDWAIEADKRGGSAKALLSKLTLFNDSRGIYAHGQAEIQGKEAESRLTIDLHNYREMIRDSIEYYNKILVTAAILSNGDKSLFQSMPEQTSDKLIAYLKAISDMPASDSDDLKISVDYKNGKATVGTLSWNDFQDYTTHLGSDVLN